jgi:DNA polymerase II large subunit
MRNNFKEYQINYIKKLLPCPFCGSGITQVVENGKVWNGNKYSESTSVSVFHYCPEVSGQPNRRIERIGRDIESAIKAWNMRV